MADQHPLAELGLQLGFSKDAVQVALASLAQSKGQGEQQNITVHLHQDEFLDLLAAAPSPGRGRKARDGAWGADAMQRSHSLHCRPCSHSNNSQTV